MDVNAVFQRLRYHHENEVVEFKQAEASFDFDDLGKYFSALSNEANLRDQEFGWLIFGVHNKTREITGTSYKNSPVSLQKLKHDLSQHTTDRNTFRDIFELMVDGKRVLLFQIPAAPRGIPMGWQGHFYARKGESLTALDMSKYEEIRRQTVEEDWSAVTLDDVTLKDLDELAVAKARVMYKKVHSRIDESEIDSWSVEELLGNSGVMIDGKLTRAAIILLGKPTSVYKLRPAVVEVTWTLKDEKDEVVDYEHFTAPFIMTVDTILAKIRNLTMRELPGGTLFPDTMKQYDDYSIREALHNAIAHQDYTLHERINFVESPGSLYYENGGSFIPGTLQKALAMKGPQRFFRNKCLCEGMVNFNMIDTVSRGIKKIFGEQLRRHFPMPDYEIDDVHKVVGVRLYGNVINEKYTQVLKENKSLSLQECIALDAIQKGHQISEETARELLEKGLIEGESPNYQISLGVAKMTHQLPEYTRVSGLERSKLKQMTLQFVQNAGTDGAKREDIYAYLKDAMPGNKTKEQHLRLLGNLLKEMKDEKTVYSIGLSWYDSSLNPTRTD